MAHGIGNPILFRLLCWLHVTFLWLCLIHHAAILSHLFDTLICECYTRIRY
jgi:cellobiose-specific phosphotransferase system component IIC